MTGKAQEIGNEREADEETENAEEAEEAEARSNLADLLQGGGREAGQAVKYSS
jgi:hypothetical protein